MCTHLDLQAGLDGYDEAERILSARSPAEPKAAESCTTHLTVCDKDGMMVAMTTTLLSSMGSRVVLPRSGVLMNNGIMWFDPRPEAKNAIAPSPMTCFPWFFKAMTSASNRF